MDNKILKIEKADITGWKITTPDGESYYIGEYSEHAGCYGNEGVTYKNRHAFETGEGVCYVPEFAFENKSENNCDLFEFYQKEIAASELLRNPYWATGGYTRQDLIDLCNGEEDFAEEIFDHLDWMAPETLWEEYLDGGLLRELERRDRIKNMQKTHNKIESKAGLLYIEKIGEQEESERIKVYDSNGRYLDYFSVESIAETANADNITPEEEYEKYISQLSKCETAKEVVDILGINTEIIETDKTEFTKKLADFVIDDDYNIDDNECINVIGEYYILIKE